jgi:hypothetical protein
MLGLSGSITLSTASTAIGDNSEEYWDTTLLLRDLCNKKRISNCIKDKVKQIMYPYVVAAFRSASRSSRSTGIATDSRTCDKIKELSYG